MTREKLVDEQRRLVRIQSSLLKASNGLDDPRVYELVQAVAQLTLTVGELLKDLRE